MEDLREKATKYVTTVLTITTIEAMFTCMYFSSKNETIDEYTINHFDENDDKTIEFKAYSHYVVERKTKEEAENISNISDGYQIYSINEIKNSDNVDVWYVNYVPVEVNLSNDMSDNVTYYDFGKEDIHKLTLNSMNKTYILYMFFFV